MNDREEAMAEAVAMFEPDGTRLVPTILSQGPWDPTTLHGGPVAAALLREIERQPTRSPMRVARYTIDLLRPVPMAPLEIRAEVVRSGRQIQLVDAVMTHETKLVSRASAVLIRCDREIEVNEQMNAAAVAPGVMGRASPATEGLGGDKARSHLMPGFIGAVETFRVQGGLGLGVPAEAWSRITVPLVAGEEVTPLQRLGCLSDFTSGVGNYMDFMTHMSPNADITCHLTRYPEGEWLGLDASTVLDPDGIGQSHARIFDDTGHLAEAQTTLVVSRRDEPLTPR